MHEITEDEAFGMAGEVECPVLAKEEADEMEAAVCLKRFPAGYVLGISDKATGLHLFFTTNLETAEQHYEHYIGLMKECGTPFAEKV